MARLTTEYTPGLKEAFGHTGTLGDLGEDLCVAQLERYDVPSMRVCTENYDISNVKRLQNQGIDIFCYNDVTLDVKNNIRNNAFFIETDQQGWLHNPKHTVEILVHVDHKTPTRCCWYERNVGRRHVPITKGNKQALEFVDVNRLPKWINIGWDTLANHIKTLGVF